MSFKAFVSTATAAVFGIVLCASAPASAKGGGPKPKPTTPKTSIHGKPAGSVAPKGGAPKGGHVSSASAKPPKGAAGGPPKGTSVKGTAPKGASPKGSSAKGGSPKGTATLPPNSTSAAPSGKHAEKAPRSSTGTPSSSATLSHAQQLLTQNTQLRAKMESRLPAGTDAIAAASEFRNLGQFVAAVNASHNQGYDFAQLKALMTGPNALSLGQAKKQLRAGGTTLPPSGPSTGPTGPSTQPTGPSTGPTGPSTGPTGPSTGPTGPSTAPTGPSTQPGSSAPVAPKTNNRNSSSQHH